MFRFGFQTLTTLFKITSYVSFYWHLATRLLKALVKLSLAFFRVIQISLRRWAIRFKERVKFAFVIICYTKTKKMWITKPVLFYFAFFCILEA